MVRNGGISRRVVFAAVLLAAIVTTISPGNAGAHAGPDPAPVLYEPTPNNSWGVAGLDPGSGNFQYYSPVFAFAEIGSTIYAGGKFTDVTNGATNVDLPYLAGFDVDSGSWVSGFAPDVDWSVFALERDAAGSRLFVGGEFPSVDGDAGHAGFAALDPATGRLDPSFGVRIARSGGSQPRVHALHREGNWLYLSGKFNRITGPDGITTWTNGVARVDQATGAVDRTWRPLVDGRAIWEVAPDPARDRVLLGGLFRQIDGVDTPAFAIVDDTTGAVADYDTGFGLEWFDRPPNTYDFVLEIEVVGDRLVIGGQEHRVVITDADLGVLSVHQTNRYNAYGGGRGGDIQDIVVADGIAYVGCHCFGQINRETVNGVDTNEYHDVRAVFAIDVATGDLVDWFQPDLSGSSGGWALHVDQNDCLWIGSDSTQAGQQPARGAAQLCRSQNLAWEAGTSVSASHPVALRPASAAIDADLQTSLDTMHHTGAGSGPAPMPFLDLDLGQQADVDDVILWAPTDVRSEQFRNLTVWASASPFPSTDPAVLAADPNVFQRAKTADHSGKRTLTFDLDERVRYVRVQADYSAGSNDTIVVAEVAVTGTPAPGGPAPTDPPTDCAVAIDGTTATVTWNGAGSNDQIIYRSVDGSPQYWRGRTSAESFDDQLQLGRSYTYLVATRFDPSGTRVVCSPDPVTAEEEPPASIDLTSTVQTRERIVLRWQPAVAVTIFRDGTEIATDSDGWYTDRDLPAGTTFSYEVVAADGATGILVVSTQP